MVAIENQNVSLSLGFGDVLTGHIAIIEVPAMPPPACEQQENASNRHIPFGCSGHKVVTSGAKALFAAVAVECPG
jgi:hypothetical protein